MATQEDRSLSAGMFIPRWMKTKMNDKFDLDSNKYSPTELDDSFMIYYRNTRGTTSDLTKNNQITNSAETKTVSASNKLPNFAKHTLPCQKFLQNGNESNSAQQVVFPTSNTTKIKSSGTDDGFKGEAAKCGSSVIRVAHQIVAGKMIRGFNIEKNNDCPQQNQGDADLPPPGFNPALRRGSRSLPASPLSSPHGSPKAQRRINKYFTGPFTDSDKQHGSWILSNLLSRRAISGSVGLIAEEENEAVVKKSASNVSIDEMPDHKKSKKHIFVAKPSELREMNFWSPTSM